MSAIVLSNDQEAAYKAFCKFIVNDTQDMFVLRGYAGTGKTALLNHFIDRLPNLYKTKKLLNPDIAETELTLTATTHKAAQAMSEAVLKPVKTIQSFLELTVAYDSKSRKQSLVPRPGSANSVFENHLIFIDEASFIGNKLLSWIRKRTQKCKIVFIGDPAQLLDRECSYSPVFSVDLPGAQLTEIVRQKKGSPIIDLATKFRQVLDTKQFFNFVPDGQVIQHLPRPEFNRIVTDEFTRNDWQQYDSKVLTWTNQLAIAYNNAITAEVKGTAQFKKGDYAIVNKYIATPNTSFKNEQIVYISEVTPTESEGLKGYNVELDGKDSVFILEKWMNDNSIIKHIESRYPCKKTKDVDNKIYHFMRGLGDLRAAYACTINKSQGSTYDRVYIDLDDLKRCNQGDNIARLLYVAVSRAKYGVVFTGDLV